MKSTEEMKPSQVWIVVNDNRGLALAETKADAKIYAMFFSKSPTVFLSYADARSAFRKQMRKYNEKIAKQESGMGRGWIEMLKRWKSGLSIIRIRLPKKAGL